MSASITNVNLAFNQSSPRGAFGSATFVNESAVFYSSYSGDGSQLPVTFLMDQPPFNTISGQPVIQPYTANPTTEYVVLSVTGTLSNGQVINWNQTIPFSINAYNFYKSGHVAPADDVVPVGILSPLDIMTYQLTFSSGLYFSFSNLSIIDYLPDGQYYYSNRAPFVTINGNSYTVTPTLDLSNIGYNADPTKNGTSIIYFHLDSVLQNSAGQLCGEVAHCQTMTLTFFAQLNYTYNDLNYGTGHPFAQVLQTDPVDNSAILLGNVLAESSTSSNCTGLGKINTVAYTAATVPATTVGIAAANASITAYHPLENVS